MKNTILFACFLISCAAFAQDYIVMSDGTKIKGEMQSAVGNTVKIKDKNNEILTFKVNELSEIYVADQNFNMKRIRLINCNYSQNDDGIQIKLLDNPIEFSNKSSNSEVSRSNSEMSIVSDNQARKASLILTCKDCSNSGKLKMKSHDRKSSVEWSFDTDRETVFPKTIEVDANKTYDFTYFDPRIGRINKKIEVKADAENRTEIFE